MLTSEDLPRINALREELRRLETEFNDLAAQKSKIRTRSDQVCDRLATVNAQLHKIVWPAQLPADSPSAKDSLAFPVPAESWPYSCPHCSQANAGLSVSEVDHAKGTLRWTCEDCGVFLTDRNQKVISIEEAADLKPADEPRKSSHAILDAVFGEDR